MTHYPWHVKAGSLISQSINALVFGGHPDMSLSTRAYLDGDTSRWWGFVRKIANQLFGAGHCEQSWWSDVEYAQGIRYILDTLTEQSR